jgi:6-phosphogluconolactonase
MRSQLLLLTLFSISFAVPVLIAGYGTTVQVHDLDTTGALKLLQNYTSIGALTYWAAHPKLQNVLYAVWESVEDGRLKSFELTHTELKETASIAVGPGPVHVNVESQGRWAYVAGYTSGNVTAVSILANGVLGAVIDSVSNGAKTHQTAIDPTGKFLFASAVDGNVIGQWNIGADGKLTSNGKLTLPASSGPRHFKFLPTNPAIAFAITETSSQIYTLSNTNGILAVSSVVKSTNTTQTTYGSTILISNDGKFLYAGNRDDVNSSSITVWSIGAAGALTQIQFETAGGDLWFPRDFNWDPTQTLLVVANQKANTLTTLKRDSATGLLSKIATVPTATDTPVFVGVIPTLDTNPTSVSTATSASTVTFGSSSSKQADSSASKVVGLFAVVLSLLF